MKRIVIDIPSLLSVKHSCTGCGPGGPCCCGAYEVCVTRAEMGRIVGFLPEAARFCRRLASKDGLDNVFDEAEAGLFALDTTSDGRCILAYRKHGRTLCSLHSAALSLGIPVAAAKPLACILWPLALGEGDPAPLAVHPDALSFKCNSGRKGTGRRLCPSLADTVAAVFGTKARERVERAVKMGRRRVTVWTKVGATSA